jgi:hypothetical protein
LESALVMEAIAAGAAWWAAAVWAPGAIAVRALRLGRDSLERFALAVALGRLLLVAVSLPALGRVDPGWLRVWPALGLLGLAGWAWRERAALGRIGAAWRRADLRWLAAGAAALAASLLLVSMIVARSGAADPTGTLVFRGRDSTDDPIVYAAAALRIARSGLPLTHPFAAGAPATAQYVALGALAALHTLSQLPMLEWAFRVLPLLDNASLALGGVALVRALGGSALAAGLGSTLLATAGAAAFLIPLVGQLLGRPVQALDTWAFFGPYLLAFNPIAAALQALFAAFLLLAAPPDTRLRRAPPLVAGLLVASLFETKLFLWAPAIAGLLAAAWLRPPRAEAPALRLAAVAALLLSLPSIAEKALAARAYGGVGGIAFTVCPGCLPRYLVDAALGSHDLSFALFQGFRPAQLLDARVLAASLGASAAVLAVGLGSRWLALAELARGLRGGAQPAATGLLRWIAFGSIAALALALGVVVRPHYLNGAQFAWFATFTAWPLAALAAARALAAGRGAPLVLLVALALPSLADLFGPLGLAAPPRMQVRPEERALLEELARAAGPDDAVMEPSMLLDTDRASPIPYLTGLPVHLSLLSVVQSLPAAERNRRFDEVVAVFAGGDPAAARRALAASGARWVYVPLGVRPGVDLRALLGDPALRGPAGAVYRLPANQGAP